jgi:hypothetical protein
VAAISVFLASNLCHFIVEHWILWRHLNLVGFGKSRIWLQKLKKFSNIVWRPKQHCTQVLLFLLQAQCDDGAQIDYDNKYVSMSHCTGELHLTAECALQADSMS